MNLSAYVGHATVHYCVLFSSRVMVRIKVRIRFRIWLVSCYAHVLNMHDCHSYTATKITQSAAPPRNVFALLVVRDSRQNATASHLR